eukprot:55985_1
MGNLVDPIIDSSHNESDDDDAEEIMSGSSYVKPLSQKNARIFNEQTALYDAEVNKFKSTHMNKPQRHGFAHETAHVVSFNNNAVKEGSRFRAETTNQNLKNGADIRIFDKNTRQTVQEVQSKCYQPTSKGGKALSRQKPKYPRQTMVVNAEHVDRCPTKMKCGLASSEPIRYEQANGAMKKGDFSDLKAKKGFTTNAIKGAGIDFGISSAISVVTDVVNGEDASTIAQNAAIEGAKGVVYGIALNMTTEVISTVIGEEIGASIAPGLGSLLGGVINHNHINEEYEKGNISRNEAEFRKVRNVVGSTFGAGGAMVGVGACGGVSTFFGPFAPVAFITCVAGSSMASKKGGEVIADAEDRKIT